MPKRAPINDVIDPVRSRLAQMVSVPVPRPVLESVAEESTAEDDSSEAQSERDDAQSRAGRRRSRRTSLHAKSGTSSLKLKHQVKVMVTEAEVRRNEETVSLVESTFGNPVNYSQIDRVLWAVLSTAEEGLRAVSSKRFRRLDVPSKGDHQGLAEYEAVLEEFLRAALRR